MSQVEENAATKAERLGLVVRRPSKHEIFVDLDSEDARGRFDGRLVLLGRSYLIEEFEVYESHTKGHYHAVVRVMERLTPNERVMCQMGLGSDLTRELLALREIQDGREDDCSVLFEKPEFVSTLAG